MASVVTVTLNPTIDKNCSIDHVVPERKLRCSEPEYKAGGGGLNVARVVQRLGGYSLAVWTRGGPMGEMLSEILDAERIEHRPIPIAGYTREHLIVLETETRQQYRFGTPGPRISEREAEQCLDTVRDLAPLPDVVVLSGSLPPGLASDFYARLAALVPEPCRVLLDTSGAALREGIWGRIYLVKPNLGELSELAGREIRSRAEITDFSRMLIDEKRVEVVVTSLGSAGAILTTAEESEHIPAPIVRIHSKVGAGDSMVAGIAYGLSEGRSVREAVRLGIATGAAAVMTGGTDLCTKSDVEQLLVS
jgi:6-phosphofructokinase 2